MLILGRLVGTEKPTVMIWSEGNLPANECTAVGAQLKFLEELDYRYLHKPKWWWFGLVCFMASQLFMGYLMQKFDSSVNV